MSKLFNSSEVPGEDLLTYLLNICFDFLESLKVKNINILKLEKKTFTPPKSQNSLEILFDKHLYITEGKMYIVIREDIDTILSIDLTNAEVCRESRSIKVDIWRLILKDIEFNKLESYFHNRKSSTESGLEKYQITEDKIRLPPHDSGNPLLTTKKVKADLHRSFIIPQQSVARYFKVNNNKLTFNLLNIGRDLKDYYSSPCKVICRSMYMTKVEITRKDQLGWAKGIYLIAVV